MREKNTVKSRAHCIEALARHQFLCLGKWVEIQLTNCHAEPETVDLGMKTAAVWNTELAFLQHSYGSIILWEYGQLTNGDVSQWDTKKQVKDNASLCFIHQRSQWENKSLAINAWVSAICSFRKITRCFRKDSNVRNKGKKQHAHKFWRWKTRVKCFKPLKSRPTKKEPKSINSLKNT